MSNIGRPIDVACQISEVIKDLARLPRPIDLCNTKMFLLTLILEYSYEEYSWE